MDCNNTDNLTEMLEATYARESKHVGEYRPNQFIITLTSDAMFFKDCGKMIVDERYLSVFHHEYWHYLCNISTLSGVKLFEISQQMISRFSRTLIDTANGVSAGSRCLSEADQEDHKTFLKIRRAIEGEDTPEKWLQEEENLRIRVVKHEIRQSQGKLNGSMVDYYETELQCECTLDDESVTQAKLMLGSWAIEESVGHTLSVSIMKAQGYPVNHIIAPAFPYLVLPSVSKVTTRKAILTVFSFPSMQCFTRECEPLNRCWA